MLLYKNEEGSALTLVIFVTLALLFLGTSLATLSTTEVRIAASQERGTQAFYLAESGAEAAWRILENVPTFRESFQENYGPGRFAVTFRDEPGNKVVITSTGIVGSATETVVLELVRGFRAVWISQ